jgi:hypothetical protein
VVEQIGQRAAHRFIGRPCPQHSAGLVAGDQVATLESPKCIHVDALDAGNIPTAQGSVTTPATAQLDHEKERPGREEAEALKSCAASGRKNAGLCCSLPELWPRRPGAPDRAALKRGADENIACISYLYFVSYLY